MSNLKTTPDALKVWARKEVIELFDQMNVLKPEELNARMEVEYEKYVMNRQIEANILMDMARNTILPAAISYQNFLLENIIGIEEAFGEKGGKMTSPQRDILSTTSDLVNSLYSSINKLKENIAKVDSRKSPEKQADGYGQVITPLIEEVGYSCTKLEGIVDNEIWPLPKFQELLFTR